MRPLRPVVLLAALSGCSSTPPAEPQPAAPRQAAPPDSSSRPPPSTAWELVMCAVDPAEPARSSCVLRDKGGPPDAPLLTVGLGDRLDGLLVLEIRLAGEGEDREAELTVDDHGARRTLRLRRGP